MAWKASTKQVWKQRTNFRRFSNFRGDLHRGKTDQLVGEGPFWGEADGRFGNKTHETNDTTSFMATFYYLEILTQNVINLNKLVSVQL